MDEQLDSPAVRGRLADVRRRKAGLEERLTQARARVATHDAEEARQDASGGSADSALRGLDHLGAS